jgi:hypothetical protein
MSTGSSAPVLDTAERTFVSYPELGQFTVAKKQVFSAAGL